MYIYGKELKSFLKEERKRKDFFNLKNLPLPDLFPPPRRSGVFLGNVKARASQPASEPTGS